MFLLEIRVLDNFHFGMNRLVWGCWWSNWKYIGWFDHWGDIRKTHLFQLSRRAGCQRQQGWNYNKTHALVLLWVMLVMIWMLAWNNCIKMMWKWMVYFVMKWNLCSKQNHLRDINYILFLFLPVIFLILHRLSTFSIAIL